MLSRRMLLIVGTAMMLMVALAVRPAYASAQGDVLLKACETGEIIRLHILANSDSAQDQAIKLRVRDAIIAAFADVFSNVADADERYHRLLMSAPDMEKVALDTLESIGVEYGARAEAGVLLLPEKQYGDALLPAGEYCGLRITLGQGEGENWFCVLFPSLCFIEEADGDEEENWKLWSAEVFSRWVSEW